MYNTVTVGVVCWCALTTSDAKPFCEVPHIMHVMYVQSEYLEHEEKENNPISFTLLLDAKVIVHGNMYVCAHPQ